MKKEDLFSTEISYRLNELPQVVQQLLPLIKAYKVIALHGALGAGKTTFTSELCKQLHTLETADSPTFSLINQYSFKDETGNEQLIYHTDWYRIKDESEAQMAGIEDMLQSAYFLCIIEWSENAPKLLPEHTLHLWFGSREEPELRTISFT